MLTLGPIEHSCRTSAGGVRVPESTGILSGRPWTESDHCGWLSLDTVATMVSIDSITGLPLPFAPPTTRGPGWPHLFLSSMLTAGIAHFDGMYQAHEQHLSRRPSPPPTEPPTTRVNSLIDECDALTHRLDVWFKESIVFKALGQAGEEPNAELVWGIASGTVGTYVALMLWAQEIRDRPVPLEWVPVYDAIAEIADGPIRQIRRFAFDWETHANDYVRAVRAGRPEPPLVITLKLAMTPAARSNFLSAARDLQRSRSARR